ncbi:hypothetical protein [Psychromonas ingrahamii]|uniref:hypothetical protein n=1 Tax=Psychromonas ingrahamii TaxID=357794 RepID=UPI0012ECF8AE|nr:hypothetical protein [Psychromonas ingrahamii]
MKTNISKNTELVNANIYAEESKIKASYEAVLLIQPSQNKSKKTKIKNRSHFKNKVNKRNS